MPLNSSSAAPKWICHDTSRDQRTRCEHGNVGGFSHQSSHVRQTLCRHNRFWNVADQSRSNGRYDQALVFRHKMETAVLVLPVATMIAFAQLRGSMPDAPAGFGTNIDLIGSLPTYVCLVLTTVFALVYCLSVPTPRPTKQVEDSAA